MFANYYKITLKYDIITLKNHEKYVNLPLNAWKTLKIKENGGNFALYYNAGIGNTLQGFLRLYIYVCTHFEFSCFFS